MKQKSLLRKLFLLCALVAGSTSAWGETYTLGWGAATGDEGTYTNFTATSGSVTDIVSFTTAANSSNAPAYNSNNKQLRLYCDQSSGNGGEITLTPAVGIAITGAVITSATSPSVSYYVNGGNAVNVSAVSNVYTISGISATSSLKIQNVNQSSNVQLQISTIQITYTTVSVPTHTATFNVNGIVSSDDFPEGGEISFPANPSDLFGKTFVGWKASTPIVGTTDEQPTLVSSAIMGEEDITFYAVFASSEETSGWLKMAASEITEAGTYALLTTDGHAFNGTISSGHGRATTNAFSFVNNIATSAPTGTCELTLTVSGSGFTMYNETNKYLYASAASSGKLAWHNTESSYWLYTNENWQYNSNNARLRSYNNSSFRTYAGNNGDVLLFAKKTTVPVYSAYCTSFIATLTLSSSCTDGAGNYYGTYSNSSAFVVPADLAVSAVQTGAGNTLIRSMYSTGDIVAANTGVLVSSSTSGKHTVVLSAEAGTAKAGNMLKPSSEAMTGSNLFYRLTMHNGTQLGFWWGAADGAAFSIDANKAYLAVPSSGGEAREGFTFGEDVTTAISEECRVKSEEYATAAMYDLQGRRVSQPRKGLYISNGRKVFVK